MFPGGYKRGMRKIKFTNGEYYHIFNRGVEKRDIFSNRSDLDRFFQSMVEFNTFYPIGSIYEASFRKNDQTSNLVTRTGRLVSFICYCLNPNHYHFILQQLAERGIEKLMHRLGLGYTNYFNKKYQRSGSLFQGTFKANHIDSNDYLLYLSAYVNLNNKVHQVGNKPFESSWEEYVKGNEQGIFCDKKIILNQFASPEDYKAFAEGALVVAQERKELEKILKLDMEA